MKVVVFLVSLILFVGGLAAFGYAFDVAPEFHVPVFAGGIVAVSLSLMIPFHLLERTD